MRLAATVLLAACMAALPAVASWEPPGWRGLEPPAEEGPGPTNPAAAVLGWVVRGYRATVSRVDGDRCPTYPTCSAYALEAVERHGALLGAVLTANRLVGEADEAAFAPRIRIDGLWRVYSPVEDDLAFLRGPLAP